MNTSPSFGQSVWLVTERELGSKLRSKSFLISTAIMFALILAAVLWAGFAAGADNRTPIAVTGGTASTVEGLDAFDVTEAASDDEARDLVSAGDVDAAVVEGGDGPLGYVVVFDDAPSSTLLLSLIHI